MTMRTLFYILCCASFLQASESFMQTVQVPMRDGILLPMDIYLPNKDAKSLPCILIRSPAGRQQQTALTYIPLVKHGYVVAIQATRSTLDLAGKTIPYRSDGWSQHQDGYDTVEWLAAQAVSNGKIGTLGFSAQGITQLLMAPTAPPSLKCQYIGVAAGSLRDHAIFPNGKLRKHQVEAWLGYYAGDPGVFSFVANHQFYDEFWEEFDSIKIVDKVNVPALFQGGWYDVFIQGTLDAFTARQENGGEGAKGRQKLVVGPWVHFWPATTQLGDFQVPEQGRQPPVDIAPARWFDHYLKGVSNQVEELPPVTYYVMGPFDGGSSSGNVWRHAERWPVPAQGTPYYLADYGGLSKDKPARNSLSIGFVHDPANPIPTLGGHNLFIDSGPMDQRPIEARDDIILFTTEPFQADLEVTGRIKARLFVSSDCCDTDFVVRLTDVYSDGRSILICDGAYRTGLLTVEGKKVEPGQIHEIEVDLESTSVVFAKGHRLRISVSGSNYPRYDLNRNVGWFGVHAGPNVVAHNKVYLGSDYPSAITLPIVTR